MTDKASQLRKFFFENPTLSNTDLEKKWEEEGHEKVSSVDFRKCRSQLSQKLFGALPVSRRGELSKSAVVIRFIENKPDWKDSQILQFLTDLGISLTRNSVASIRSVYNKKKKGVPVRSAVTRVRKKKNERGSRSRAIREYIAANPGSSSKMIVEGLAKSGIKVSLGLASVIRYSKKKSRISPDPRQNSGPRARKGESNSVDLLKIEETLDSLISAAQDYGNSKIVEAIRRSRREVSAEILAN